MCGEIDFMPIGEQEHLMTNESTIIDRICEGALAGTGLYCFNRLYNDYACRKKLLNSSRENYYNWKGINVFFLKKGSGSPVILLHALHPAASSVEWSRVEDKLAESHAVYMLDLPGCGRSEKPDTLYTNFYYVDLLRSFIRDLGIERPSVVASNLTCSVAVSLSNYAPGLIERLVLINPPSLTQMEETPDSLSRFCYRVLRAPLLGTTLYTVLSSRPRIDGAFSERYFYNPFNDTDELVDSYLESAHLERGHGHFFAASVCGKYLNANLEQALKKADTPMKIIEGRQSWGAEETLAEWVEAVPAIEIAYIEHTKELPMLEEPDRTVWEIESFI